MDSERRSQRYPSHRPLQIRCDTWDEFVDTYASDICRGGMFVQSDETPEVLSEVELKLNLPDGIDVAIHARVVHVVTPEQAEQSGRFAGMGVEFVHVDAEQKRQIMQLVEFARNQGEGADPNASFARTLLETSASMPASEVAARLSMIPSTPGTDAGNAARTRKSSQVGMPAVQLNDPEERADPSHVAVRPPARKPIPRTATQPLHGAAEPSAGAPIARTPTGSVAEPAARPSSNKPIVRTPTGSLTEAAVRSSSSKPMVRTPTGPLHGATGRSGTNTPIVRTPTGPLHSATGRSSANTPIVRTPTGPLTAAGARPNSAPIARTPTGPLGTPSPANDRTPSGPLGGSAEDLAVDPETGLPLSGPAPSPSGQPLAPPKPTDLNRLKVVLNSLAHKHFEDAARQAKEMLVDNPGDPQVLKWEAICFARMALARNEPAAAADHYEKALRYEENNREARDFVKTFHRDRKLNALPFGRYFTKKK